MPLLEMVTVFANRYIQPPAADEVREVQTPEDIAKYWARIIGEHVVGHENLDRVHARGLVACMLAVTSGFAARQDPSVATVLAPVLPTLLQQNGGPLGTDSSTKELSIGEFTARQLYVVAKAGEALAKSNHATVRPFHRQWTYETLVRPLLKLALAPSPNSTQNSSVMQRNYRIAGLTALRDLDFGLYEADKEDVARLALGALSSVGSLPAEDIQTTLQTLRKILIASPRTVQDHLKSTVTACVAVLERWLTPQPGIIKAPVLGAMLMALEVLYILPNGLSVPQKEPHLQTVRDALDLATASTSRQLRQRAQYAKSKWA
jgi:hypothetical protein